MTTSFGVFPFFFVSFSFCSGRFFCSLSLSLSYWAFFLLLGVSFSLFLSFSFFSLHLSFHLFLSLFFPLFPYLSLSFPLSLSSPTAEILRDQSANDIPCHGFLELPWRHRSHASHQIDLRPGSLQKPALAPNTPWRMLLRLQMKRFIHKPFHHKNTFVQTHIRPKCCRGSGPKPGKKWGGPERWRAQRVGARRVGRVGVGRVGPRRVRGPKFRTFSLIPLHFTFVSRSGGLLVELWPLATAMDHPNCRNFGRSREWRGSREGGPADGVPGERGPGQWGSRDKREGSRGKGKGSRGNGSGRGSLGKAAQIE